MLSCPRPLTDAVDLPSSGYSVEVLETSERCSHFRRKFRPARTHFGYKNALPRPSGIHQHAPKCGRALQAFPRTFYLLQLPLCATH